MPVFVYVCVCVCVCVCVPFSVLMKTHYEFHQKTHYGFHEKIIFKLENANFWVKEQPVFSESITSDVRVRV
jgi:hypothetical protein